MLAGYPVVDVKVTLVDGQYHDVDSSEMAFKIAGQVGFRKAAAKAKPVLLEPIMAVEVVTPEEYMGDVIGDLNSRRGRIEGMEANGNDAGDPAQVPLVGDVRLLDRPPVADPGPRHVHDAVRLLPGGVRRASPPRSSSVCAASDRRTTSAL